MHGPSLAETTAFVAVVELRSFTKAAKQLALSPPRVSEMVRNLEDRLGVRLVERTTRSVAPTAAGERLLAWRGRSSAALLEDFLGSRLPGRGVQPGQSTPRAIIQPATRF